MVVTETSALATDEDAARRVLMVHRLGADDLCDGCLENRSVYSWFPCEQARWALKVTAGGTGGERS